MRRREERKRENTNIFISFPFQISYSAPPETQRKKATTDTRLAQGNIVHVYSKLGMDTKVEKVQITLSLLSLPLPSLSFPPFPPFPLYPPPSSSPRERFMQTRLKDNVVDFDLQVAEYTSPSPLPFSLSSPAFPPHLLFTVISYHAYVPLRQPDCVSRRYPTYSSPYYTSFFSYSFFSFFQLPYPKGPLSPPSPSSPSSFPSFSPTLPPRMTSQTWHLDNGCGHTKEKAPHPVRSEKLSSFRRG